MLLGAFKRGFVPISALIVAGACGGNDAPDFPWADGILEESCAGERDECGVCGGEGKSLWYADFDDDGLGDPDATERACERPEGFVDNRDDEDPQCFGLRVWYEDQDGDELGDPTRPIEACNKPDGYVINHDDDEPDCATNDSDECGECAGPGPRTRYADADGDGLGDPAVALALCELPDGWVNNDDDDEPACATNDTDDCGICGGGNESRDCAGVCDGEAAVDACDRCSGGTTGVKPATRDSDDDGIPDACDQCVNAGVARLIVQWTDVRLYEATGGPYTFQAVLFENGDFAYLYPRVEPFGAATVTVGHQGPSGAGAVELGYNSRYPTAYPVVYFRRSGSGLASVEYNVDVPFVDIRASGAPLGLGDDSQQNVELPFGFPFASASYPAVEVSSNGFLAFGAPYGDYQNLHLPASGLGALLAVFWDDLDPTGGGSVAYQVMDGACEADCNGDRGGVAEVDECGVCAGGTTGIVPEADRDCAGDCQGDAYLDECRRCVGGNTGLSPSEPGACPTGPDILVDGQYLRATIEEDFIDVPSNSCLVAEACVTGTGRRRVVRFGTRLANVGNQDVVIGAPEDGNPLWSWDPCHGHYHFEDYADYELVSVSSGETLPIGTKNGFCVLDLEVWDRELAQGGCNTYDCGNQGISVGCADTYHAELQCQWVDITGVPNGEYDLRVTANPARVLPELDHGNNSATVRISIGSSSVGVVN